MEKSLILSQSALDKLKKIEEAYHDFVHDQMKHNDWEHINFPEYAVAYHDFYSHEVALNYWSQKL
jgi:hypothetical protein